MKVDKIIAAIRPRTAYEAMDLGIAVTRDAGWAVWGPWFAVTLPVFALCNLMGWYLGYVWLAAVLMWWFKLLFDRIPLYVLSRYLFGQTPSLRETLGALPGLWLAALPGALFWDRLDFARSFDLPVAQLEGMKWMARIKRQRLLQSTARYPAVMLTFVCLNLEIALVMGLWVLVLMFVPFEYLSEVNKALWTTFFQDVTPLSQLCINAAAYLAMSAIEPLYVGAGFGLYLNRRTELEAWDIELAFRRLAERVEGLKRGAAAVVLVLALCLFAALPARRAEAAEAAAPAAATTVGAPASATAAPRVYMMLPLGLPEDADARFAKSVKLAYANPDLSPHGIVGHWQLRKPSKPEQQEATVPWLLRLQALLGKAIGYLPWLLGLILLGVLVRYRRWLLDWFSTGGPAPRARYAAGVTSVDVGADPLPDDVAGAALALWTRGEQREALALLYRGTMWRVQELTGRELPQGATEGDYLRAAAGLPPASGEGARRIVRSWQYAAYAHRFPQPEDFDGLLAAWREGLEAQP